MVIYIGDFVLKKTVVVLSSRRVARTSSQRGRVSQEGEYVTKQAFATNGLNRGLKESNCDQLYAYLKQHEVHANENKIMMERFGQPNNDPLALVSDASVQQYPAQSSSLLNPQQKSLLRFIQHPALLDSLDKSHLPQLTINLELRLLQGTKLLFKDGKSVVHRFPWKIRAQNRGGMINPGQAKPIKCYNYNGLGHIARECPRPKRLQDSDYFKDKVLLCSPESGSKYWIEEQSLFLGRGTVTKLMMMCDDSQEEGRMNLALNWNHVF
ncbi:retrovirus-related pol polyprotein from transposon TNT 1-94 [Tanacetum coccineum]